MARNVRGKQCQALPSELGKSSDPPIQIPKLGLELLNRLSQSGYGHGVYESALSVLSASSLTGGVNDEQGLLVKKALPTAAIESKPKQRVSLLRQT